MFITDIGCLIPADEEEARVIYPAISGSSPTVRFYLFHVPNTKQLLSGTLPVFQFDKQFASACFHPKGDVSVWCGCAATVLYQWVGEGRGP